MDLETRDDIVDALQTIDAGIVSDVLDSMGMKNFGLAPTFRPMTGNRIAGVAFTIRGRSVLSDQSGDMRKMQACGAARGKGIVTVWANGDEGTCCFGELIATSLKLQGVSGALVDGGIRDVRMLREIGFPVFARFTSAVQSIGRWQVVDSEVPVELPGANGDMVRIRPGDYIVGDDDGVMVIPAECATDVIAQSLKLEKREALIRSALNEGQPLSDCLKRFGHV